MVTNAAENPGQAEVLFVIENTAANGAFISELKTNYILPTLEYFHGGALEEGGGSGSVYGIVAYKSADCHPGLPVSTYGPFNSPQNVCETIDKLQFIDGRSEQRACVAEALTAAWSCFEELGRTDVARHVILLCCSAPYTAISGGLVPIGSVLGGSIEAVARGLHERGVLVSIASGRRTPALLGLFEQTGGELAAAQQRNYAKDPRHLVLLRGYSLKERPPSPAPPPVPDIQTDIYSAGRGTVQGVPGVQVGQVPNVGQVGQVPNVGQVGPGPVQVPQVSTVGQVGNVGQVGARPQFVRGAVRGNWMPPRQPLYANNSALLTQLAQPSYPPPAQPQQSQMQRLPMLVPSPSPAAPVPPTPQRTYIWSGVLEWMEKAKGPSDQQKVTKLLPCQVSANSKDVEPDLKVDTWPNKLLMQLMPKQLISSIGGQYLKDSKSVLFHLQSNEVLDSLTKVLVNGFAGCVHFSPMPNPPQCDIKVLILLYTVEKKAYLGFIPNNQATFVERLKKVIQQQKMSQIINKQGPSTGPGANPMGAAALGPAPSLGPAGSMGPSSSMGPGTSMGPTSSMGPTGSMPGGSMGASSMAGQMQAPSQSMLQQGGQMQQHQQPGMMVSKGSRVSQLDGLEAARQQNLEKIHQLQQTLEAAHQQEAQFKSQMDIMTHVTHLQAAQQQEQQYKQMEQQLQQLRGAAAAQHQQPRLMRPMMSSNPGLRHLLQQQPQYRPAAAGTRPPSQPQQFEDVPWNSMDQLQ